MSTPPEEPIAGPSKPITRATKHALPQNTYFSIEYPGYVKDTSVPQAVSNLGGQAILDSAFRRKASKAESLVELRLRPDSAFAHPIPGDIVPTNNILLKVVKRKRRRRQDDTDDGMQGEYTAEAVGIIPKTLRFRSMADYQYQPDANDPIPKLRLAMQNMDSEAIMKYRIPDEKEDYLIPSTDSVQAEPMDVEPQIGPNPKYPANNSIIDPQLLDTASPNADEPMAEQTVGGALADGSKLSSTRSNLRLIPPPIFTRQFIAQNYNFKANPASIVTTTVNEETGEERKRLVNRMRWKGYGPITVMFADANVPTKATALAESKRSEVHQLILKRLQELFNERPIWTRASLFNQFSVAESRELLNSKSLLPLVCYVFSDGPWRDTLVAFNYDPRKLPEARIYQRLYFRNLNHPIHRVSVLTRRQDRTAEAAQMRAANQNPENDSDRVNSHIFDGKTLTKETASFQLCDITDPLLKEMIDDPNELRETCNERDGWYTSASFDRIKAIVRHKFFSLLEGYVATDEECLAICEAKEGKAKTVPTTWPMRPKPGKRNMAKGAQRPEEAAAVRLRAALQNSARNPGGPS